MGILVSLFLLIFVAIFVWILWRTRKPNVYYNPDGNAAQIVTQMKSINEKYFPTPWLISPDIHTMWGMRFRPRSKLSPVREEINFPDGGCTQLDWFLPKTIEKNAPVLIVNHTMGGGTREPCTNNFAAAVMRHGWRAVVANCRACSGAPITSARLFSAIEIDDLQAIVKHVQTVEFHPKHTFMAGFSLGAIQTVFYAMEESNIDAYMLVSHIYRSLESAMMLERPLQRRLYLPVIVQKLCHAVAKNNYVSDDLKRAVHAKTLCEFDDLFKMISSLEPHEKRTEAEIDEMRKRFWIIHFGIAYRASDDCFDFIDRKSCCYS